MAEDDEPVDPALTLFVATLADAFRYGRQELRPGEDLVTLLRNRMRESLGEHLQDNPSLLGPEDQERVWRLCRQLFEVVDMADQLDGQRHPH